MIINDFKVKFVPGLYSFDHFEHPCGAFIQMNTNTRIYRDSRGSMFRDLSWAELLAHVAADQPLQDADDPTENGFGDGE